MTAKSRQGKGPGDGERGLPMPPTNAGAAVLVAPSQSLSSPPSEDSCKGGKGSGPA